MKSETCHLIRKYRFNRFSYLHIGKNMARKKLRLCSVRPAVGNRMRWYGEHIQALPPHNFNVSNVNLSFNHAQLHSLMMDARHSKHVGN
jgi:hypothetical protein